MDRALSAKEIAKIVSALNPFIADLGKISLRAENIGLKILWTIISNKYSNHITCSHHNFFIFWICNSYKFRQIIFLI